MATGDRKLISLEFGFFCINKGRTWKKEKEYNVQFYGPVWDILLCRRCVLWTMLLSSAAYCLTLASLTGQHGWALFKMGNRTAVTSWPTASNGVVEVPDISWHEWKIGGALLPDCCV